MRRAWLAVVLLAIGACDDPFAPRDVRPGMDYSEQLQLAIENAAAFVVLVTDMANYPKVVEVRADCPSLQHVFVIDGEDVDKTAQLMSLTKRAAIMEAQVDVLEAGGHAPLGQVELQRLAGEDVVMQIRKAHVNSQPPTANSQLAFGSWELGVGN